LTSCGSRWTAGGWVGGWEGWFLSPRRPARLGVCPHTKRLASRRSACGRKLGPQELGVPAPVCLRRTRHASRSPAAHQSTRAARPPPAPPTRPRHRAKDLAAANQCAVRLQRAELASLSDALALLRQQIEIERGVGAAAAEQLSRAAAARQDDAVGWGSRREEDAHARERQIEVRGGARAAGARASHRAVRSGGPVSAHCLGPGAEWRDAQAGTAAQSGTHKTAGGAAPAPSAARRGCSGRPAPPLDSGPPRLPASCPPRAKGRPRAAPAGRDAAQRPGGAAGGGAGAQGGWGSLGLFVAAHVGRVRKVWRGRAPVRVRASCGHRASWRENRRNPPRLPAQARRDERIREEGEAAERAAADAVRRLRAALRIQAAWRGLKVDWRLWVLGRGRGARQRRRNQIPPKPIGSMIAARLRGDGLLIKPPAPPCNLDAPRRGSSTRPAKAPKRAAARGSGSRGRNDEARLCVAASASKQTTTGKHIGGQGSMVRSFLVPGRIEPCSGGPD
jgi:hypothetical protein